MSLPDLIDKANTPQVSVPTTLTATAVGTADAFFHITPEQGLLLASGFVIFMQGVIAWPKFYATMKGFFRSLRGKSDGDSSQAGNARAGAAVSVALAGVIAAAIGYTLPHTSGFEGREYVPYPDIGGVWTACDGATKGIKLDYVYTDKECDEKTAADLQHAADVVKRYVVPEVAATMPVTRWAAFIDWVYNLGEGNFRSSTMLKKLNAGDTLGACTAIMDWMFVRTAKGGVKDKRDGKVDGMMDCSIAANGCGGIPARREWQRDTCLLPPPAPAPEVAVRPWWKFWG